MTVFVQYVLLLGFVFGATFISFLGFKAIKLI
uniref:Cytochrome b6/f complex subunit 6 n=1 Tax=Glaucocystis incrassata TaxID=1789788 RepID=A0A3G1IVI0_9EUKA|nr:cytochrome b6/f complex subunit 6 [Glaucocystis incrassata]ASQ40042.1 cytochrome b6/f complex subunit 6 [Glaucocystis incrassata]